MPLQGLKLSCGQNVEGGRDFVGFAAIAWQIQSAIFLRMLR